MARQPSIQQVERYEVGTNERLDAIYDGEPTWIVQGSLGRRPIIALTEQAARQRYLGINNPLFDEEEEIEESA